MYKNVSKIFLYVTFLFVKPCQSSMLQRDKFLKLECRPMPNVMAALPSAQRRKVSVTLTTRVLCSNSANIGERKTWTKSELSLCTRQNSVRGHEHPKCIYSVPAQETTAKHRAKFGWPPLRDVAAVTKPRRETGWNMLGCPKLAHRSQPR